MIHKGSIVKYRNRYFKVTSSDYKHAYITKYDCDPNKPHQGILYVCKSELTELKVQVLSVSENIIQSFISGIIACYDIPGKQYQKCKDEDSDLTMLINRTTKSRVLLSNLKVMNVLHTIRYYDGLKKYAVKAPFIRLSGCGVISSYSGSSVYNMLNSEHKRLLRYAKRSTSSTQTEEIR